MDGRHSSFVGLASGTRKCDPASPAFPQVNGGMGYAPVQRLGAPRQVPNCLGNRSDQPKRVQNRRGGYLVAATTLAASGDTEQKA